VPELSGEPELRLILGKNRPGHAGGRCGRGMWWRSGRTRELVTGQKKMGQTALSTRRRECLVFSRVNRERLWDKRRLSPFFTGVGDWGDVLGLMGLRIFLRRPDIENVFLYRMEGSPQFDRTGVRLIGPKPVWARKDGGEAGLHPSNNSRQRVRDRYGGFHAYMPGFLGPDGRAWAFVMSCAIVNASCGKIGQLKARRSGFGSGKIDSEPVLRRNADIAIRTAGDRYLLVEYGPIVSI